MGLKGVLFQNPPIRFKNSSTTKKLTIKKLKNKFFKKEY